MVAAAIGCLAVWRRRPTILTFRLMIGVVAAGLILLVIQRLVVTDREKITYYAGATGRALPPDAPSLIREARGLPRAWVAFYYEGTECCGELAAGLDAPDSGFRLVQRLEEPSASPPRTLLLYLSEPR